MESKFQLTFDYNNVYNNNNPVLPGDGDSQPAPGKTYRVDPIGIVSPSNNEFSWYCLMDIEAVQKLAKENSDYMQLDTKNYNRVMVKCENTDVVSEVKAAIDEMGYGTSSLQDALEQAEKQMQQIQYLLGAIGGVSLLVAAIGIMNTMMMSIYERTKEIGIIKVLGCRMDNIAELFLTEAAYIGFFGGAAGLGISYGLSAVINHFVGESGKSILTITSNVEYGKATGAFPSGHKKGTPYAPGANPENGMDSHGMLPSMFSVGKIDYNDALDGISLTNTITPDGLGRDEDERIGNLVGILDAGNGHGLYHANINVLRKETMEDAVEHPEKYPHLTVRVSGYAVNFVKLTKEQQLDVISRTFHQGAVVD